MQNERISTDKKYWVIGNYGLFMCGSWIEPQIWTYKITTQQELF